MRMRTIDSLSMRAEMNRSLVSFNWNTDGKIDSVFSLAGQTHTRRAEG